MRKVSALCVVLLLQNSFAWLATSAALADPVNLDLSSTTHSLPASALGAHGNVAIRTSSGTTILQSNTMLTPAQYAAAQQVMATGRQTLDLGVNGNAVGGRFDTGINPQLSALVIPTNVTLLQNFAAGSVSVGGNITNAGNIFAYSNNDAVRNAIMNATSIQNLPAGVISSIVPQSVLSGAGISHTVPNLALTLNASTGIQNAGQITAGGAVNINTPNVTNSGVIASTTNSVNFTSTDSIHVDNTKGSISAPNGNINFRTPDFADKKDLVVVGGTLAAQQVNLNSGDGHIKVDADNIAGKVNITGGTSVVAAHGGNLELSSVKLSGDPAFYNTNGNVILPSTLSFSGQSLAVIASTDILAPSGVNIDTSSLSGNGGSVSLIAGANFGTNGASSGSNDTTTTLSVSGPSASGGNVFLSGLVNINTSSFGSGTNGGNVQIVAFQGIRGDGGIIQVPGNVNTVSSTGMAGVVIAAAPNGINIGNILAVGAVNNPTTSVVQSGQADVNGPVNFLDGAQQSGNFVAPHATTRGDISLATTQISAPMLVKGGGNILTADLHVLGLNSLTVIGYGDDSQHVQLDSVSGKDILIQNRAPNGSLTLNGTSSSTGTMTLEAAQIDGGASINGTNDLRINLTGNGTSQFGNLNASAGDVVVRGPGSASVASIASGGNTIVDLGGTFTFQSQVDSNGQVDLRAASIVQSGAGSSGFAVRGVSVLLSNPDPVSGLDLITKPLLNSYQPVTTIPQTSRLSLNDAVEQLNTVDTSGNGNPSHDLVLVSSGSIPGGTYSTEGPSNGGQVVFVAGAASINDGNYIQVLGPSGTAGSFGGGVGVSVNHGAPIVIESFSATGAGANISVFQIISDTGPLSNQTNAGNIRIIGDSGSSLSVNGNIQADGIHGGNVLMSAGTFTTNNQYTISARGAGSGGGSVTMNLLDAGTLHIDGTAQSFAIDVQESVAGSAGTISLNAVNKGVSFTIDGDDLTASSLNGAGGNISIMNNAGSGIQPARTSLINNPIAANGLNGAGGTITISSFNGAPYDLSIGTDIQAVGGGSSQFSDGGTIYLSAGGGSTSFGTMPFNHRLDVSGGAGTGGSVTLTNAGTVGGPLFGVLQVYATGADGGKIDIDMSHYTSALQFSSTGFLFSADSTGQYGGSGGSVSIKTGGPIAIDSVNYFHANAVSNGNGGSLSVTTPKDVTFNTSDVNLDGQGVGNGGHLSVDALGTITIQTPTNSVSARGGSTAGDGGTIIFGAPVIDGLNVSGHGAAKFDIDPNSGPLFDTNATTMGSGGTVSIWANSGLTAIAAEASGTTGLSAAEGGVDAHGGSINIISSGAMDFVNSAFTANTLASGTGTADGGSVKIFAIGGNDINILGTQIDVGGHASNGSMAHGGNVALVALAAAPNHDASGGFLFDRYGGGITLSGDGPAMSGANGGGSGTLVIEINSLKPVTLDLSGNSITAGNIYITNLGPGGVNVASTTNLALDAETNTAPNLNISASHISFGQNASLSVNSSQSGANISIATTDPAAASSLGGSITLASSPTAGDIDIHGTGDTNVAVIAGGNLNVGNNALAFLTGGSSILLSAGVVPDSVSYPTVDGTTNCAPPQLTNINSVNRPLLSTQFGTLRVLNNFNLTGDGTRLSLVSNSQDGVNVGGGPMQNVGTITLHPSGTGALPSLIIANFNSSGVSIEADALNTANLSGASGTPVTPGALTNHTLPIPVGQGNGVLEIYTPGFLAFNGSQTQMSEAGSTQGGTFYMYGGGGLQGNGIAFDAHSDLGNGGAVYLNSGSQLQVKPGQFLVDVRGGVGAPNTGNAGIVNLTAAGDISVLGGAVLMQAGTTSGIGANLTVQSTGGNVLWTGDIDVNGPSGLGTVFIETGTNAASTFEVTGNASPSIVNGVVGHITTSPNGGVAVKSFSLSPFTLLLDDGAVPVSPLTVTAVGSLSIISQDNSQGSTLRISRAVSDNGDVLVQQKTGILQIEQSAKVWAENGSVTLQNLDTQNATAGITILQNANITSSSNASGNVNIVIGQVPNPPSGTAPTDPVFNQQAFGGGQILFTGNVTTSSAGTNSIVLGAYNDGANIVVSNASTGGGNITFQGGGTRVQAVPFNNLDLSDTANVAYLQILKNSGVISGTFAPSNGPISLSLPQYISTRFIEKLNIRSGDQVTLQNSNADTGFYVNTLTQNATAVVDGSLIFGGVSGVFNAKTFVPNGNFQLTMGPNGSITSAGDLSVMVGTSNSSQPAVVMDANATIAANNALSFSTNGSGATLGTLKGNAVSMFVSQGALLQAPGGSIQSNDVSISFGAVNLGRSAQPINVTLANPNSLINTATLKAISGAASSVFLNASADGVLPFTLDVEGASNNVAFNVTSDSSMYSASSGNGGSMLAALLNLTSTGAFIGTTSRQFMSQSPLLQFASAGQVNALNAGGAALLDSTAVTALNVQNNFGDLTVNNVDVTNGSIAIVGGFGAKVMVAPNSTVYAEAGDVTINAGTIEVGNNALIAAVNPSGNANVLLQTTFVSSGSTTSNPPTGITTHENNGGTVLFGTSAPVMAIGSNDIYATNAGANVTLDPQSLLAPGSIQLDGNVRIVAASALSVSAKLGSLDFTDSSVPIQVGALQTAGLIGTGANGEIVLRPINLENSLSGFNVTPSTTLLLEGFSTKTPINVNLPQNFGPPGPPPAIDGTVLSNGSLSLAITDPINPAFLSVGGTLMVNGDLTMNIANIGIAGGTVNANNINLITAGGVSVSSLNGVGGVLASSLPGSIIISSLGSANLTGNGQIVSSTVLVQSGSDAHLSFGGQFLSDLTVQAGSNSVIASGLSVSGVVTINSADLVVPSGLTARELVLNSPTGIGTINNPNGDVVLTANLKTNGQSLAILASGNVIANSKTTSIDLSNKNAAVNGGNGGTLTVIAGYDFTTASAASTSPVTGIFTIGNPSTTGGSILLPAVNVTTASTLSSGNSSGGSITGIAHSGTVNAGSIFLGNLTTTSNAKTGNGGSVYLLGDGGVVTGKILATGGGRGGAVELYADKPAIIGGAVQVNNGALQGPGIFVPTVTTTSTGGTVRTGTISTSSVLGTSGNVIIDSRVGTTTGTISTQGFTDLILGVQQMGGSGNVMIQSPQGPVTTGGITTFGLNGTKTSAGGATAGNVLINGWRVAVGGNIDAHGGSAAANTGAGGNAGNVNVQTTLDNGVLSGLVQIKGGISAAGGAVAKNGGTSGNGGLVNVTGGAVSIGALSGFSINVAPGAGTTAGQRGDVNLASYAVQDFPAAFDLTSTKASIIAFPGALFTVAAGSPINGVASPIKITATETIGKKDVPSANGNGLLLASPGNPTTTFSATGLTITIHGTSTQTIQAGGNPVDFIAADINGKRSLVSPVVAASLFQTTHGYSQDVQLDGNLVFQGGSVTAAQAELPPSFTAFNVPANASLQVSGQAVQIRLPAKTAINGSIQFTDQGGTNLIDFGSGTPTLNGDIDATGSNLILSSTGAKMAVTGTIEAANLLLGRPTASALTFSTTGPNPNGLFTGINASILLAPSVDPTMAFNFVQNGTAFFTGGQAVTFGQLPVNTSFSALSLASAKQAATHPVVTLGFAMADGNGTPVAAPSDGLVQASSITIKSMPLKVGGVAINTPITIAQTAVLLADKNIAVTSAGELTSRGALIAGIPSSNLPSTGTFNPSLITSKGSITLTSTASDVQISGVLNSFGGDIKIVDSFKTATLNANDINFGPSVTLQANGGNVQILTLGNIIQSSTNSIFIDARAMGTKASDQKGGGIELAAGTTTSALSGAFNLKPGTRSGTASIGGNPNIIPNGSPTIGGAVQVLLGKTPGTVTLGIPNNSAFQGTLHVDDGGAIVLQGQNTKVIQLNTVFMQTSAFKPIAYRPSSNGFDAVFNPSEDSTFGTAYGDIDVRGGAIVSISREANGVRVVALSGPGDVVIRSGKQRVLVAPGHEVLLTTLDAEAEMAKADGVGRRNAARVVLSNGVVVHRCEVSLVSFMAKAGVQDKAIREKMLKTAAAVYVASGGKRGAYTARR